MATTRSAPRRISWRQRVRAWPALLTLLLVPAVIGATDIADWCAAANKMKYLAMVSDRVEKIRPFRRTSPLRYLNISDEEAREVEDAAAEVTGTEWISIGAVVTGCPCEDGDGCTDQVWVQTHKDQSSVGVLLSKVDGHWKIGYVQRWWLRYEYVAEEKNHASTVAESAALAEESNRLLDLFASCGLDKEALAKLRDQELPACLHGGKSR